MQPGPIAKNVQKTVGNPETNPPTAVRRKLIRRVSIAGSITISRWRATNIDSRLFAADCEAPVAAGARSCSLPVTGKSPTERRLRLF
jgi:hypothetical protein